MIENALILAAGKGTRMWPLTEDIPKPLLPISGIPIIKRQIDELKKVGVKKLYILIGYQMNEISDYIDKTETEIEVNYIIQEKQKGTGHAVKMAENKISEITNIDIDGSSAQYYDPPKDLERYFQKYSDYLSL